ncbi:MAG: hypothetical protein IPP59_11970 [Betaproteobacteria bacterium]|nr:hypothetical protein [Candidatus Dechloromonas phosphorivorans]
MTDELNLLGATVGLWDGRFGTVKELRPNRPWYFSVEVDGQPEMPVLISRISIGGRKLSEFLVEHGAVLDREGWTSLVRANYPNAPSSDGPVRKSEMEAPRRQFAAKYHAGRVKWFGGTNSHTRKTNQFGFVTTCEGVDVYFHKSAVSAGLELIPPNECVIFSLGEHARSKLAAESLHVVRHIKDTQSLREFFIDGTEDARSLILAQAKTYLVNEPFIGFVNGVLEYLGPNDFSYIYKQLGPILVVQKEAKPILGRLRADDQIELFSWLSDLSGVQENVIELLKSDEFQTASEEARARFWARHKPKDSGSPFYPFLDQETKRAIWRETVLPTLPVKVRIEALLRERAKLSAEDWRSLAFKLIRNEADRDERLLILSALPASVQLDYLGDADVWQAYSDIAYSALVQTSTDETAREIVGKFWQRHRPSSTSDCLYPFAPSAMRKEIWRETVLPTLPIAERIDALKEEVRLLSPPEWRTLSVRLLRLAGSLGERIQLTQALDAAACLEFIGQTEDWMPYREAARAVLERNETVPAEVLAVFWRNVVPETPKDPIFKFAPIELKKRVCRIYYDGPLRKLSSLFPFEAAKPASVPASEIYKALSDADRELAGLWQHGHGDPEKAKMLSARGAELAAARFYALKGHAVQDVATHQTDGTSGDWRTHDLILDGEIPIDVKNSRCPKNNTNFYVEHTVPRFKTDRRSKHVRIAGILSPYLQLKYVDAPEDAWFKIEPIRFLGETSWPEIERLIDTFSSEKLEVRNVVDRVVPHWLFDYPDAWYRDYANKVAMIRVAEWPSEDEWPLLTDQGAAMDVVPQLCAAGMALPSHFRSALSAWQTGLYRKIQAACPVRPSLPAIFLIVLTDFLEYLQLLPEGYSPRVYKSFLYGSRYVPNERANSPLGLIDPVGLVDGLCSSLEILWQHRQRLNLARFKNFRFSGLGLLQGREGISSPWETILAYCGGREYGRDIENKVLVDNEGKPTQILGKCGQAPLVLGREKLCPACHKLVCGSCGFYSQKCEQERFEQLAEANRLAFANARDEDAASPFEDVEIPAYASEHLPLEFYEDHLNRS